MIDGPAMVPDAARWVKPPGFPSLENLGLPRTAKGRALFRILSSFVHGSREAHTRTLPWKCVKARRGPMKAAVAVAASILTAAYFILHDGLECRDLGPDFFVRRDKARMAHRRMCARS